MNAPKRYNVKYAICNQEKSYYYYYHNNYIGYLMDIKIENRIDILYKINSHSFINLLGIIFIINAQPKPELLEIW